jgi:hypothetical protein
MIADVKQEYPGREEGKKYRVHAYTKEGTRITNKHGRQAIKKKERKRGVLC